jgi:hypothetical protein
MMDSGLLFPSDYECGTNGHYFVQTILKKFEKYFRAGFAELAELEKQILPSA